MKEGARAERGTVLFSLSCFSGFSGPPNQADGIGQIDQLPDTGYQMLDGKTWPSFFTSFYSPLNDLLVVGVDFIH